MSCCVISDSHSKRGRGKRVVDKTTTYNYSSIIVFIMILMKDLPFPLRLTFEAREGAKS